MRVSGVKGERFIAQTQTKALKIREKVQGVSINESL
jgi:hypothetical protein